MREQSRHEPVPQPTASKLDSIVNELSAIGCRLSEALNVSDSRLSRIGVYSTSEPNAGNSFAEAAPDTILEYMREHICRFERLAYQAEEIADRLSRLA